MIPVFFVMVLIIMIVVVTLLSVMLLPVLIMFRLKLVTEVNIVIYAVVINGSHRIKDIALKIEREVDAVRTVRI